MNILSHINEKPFTNPSIFFPTFLPLNPLGKYGQLIWNAQIQVLDFTVKECKPIDVKWQASDWEKKSSPRV
jgi:hypothetical protein